MYLVILKQTIWTSIITSIFIIFFMILKNIKLNKYSHSFNYSAILLILIRLLFVKNFEINIPIKIYEKTTLYSNVGSSKGAEYIVNLKKVVQEVSQDKTNYLLLVFVLWAVGFTVALYCFIYKYIKFHRSVNILSKDAAIEVRDIFNEEKKALKVKKDIKVKLVRGISSPVLVGIFKPRVILPKVSYDKEQLRWIFRHELIHYKRWDNLMKLFMGLAVSIHFFNPLVYILRKYFENACELSCDERVLRNSTIEERKNYAKILIESIRFSSEIRGRGIASQFNNKEIDEIKRRIDNMLNIKSKKKGIIATALLVAVAGGSMFTVKTFADTPEDYIKKYEPYMDNGEVPESVFDIKPENNSLVREEIEKGIRKETPFTYEKARDAKDGEIILQYKLTEEDPDYEFFKSGQKNLHLMSYEDLKTGFSVLAEYNEETGMVTYTKHDEKSNLQQ